MLNRVTLLLSTFVVLFVGIGGYSKTGNYRGNPCSTRYCCYEEKEYARRIYLYNRMTGRCSWYTKTFRYYLPLNSQTCAVTAAILLKGETGSNGTIGITGRKGARGPRGFRGVKGDKGEPGSEGFAALVDGSPGIKGSPGDNGIPGDRGPMGPPGPQGEPGLPGIIGHKGNPGQRGLKGEPGVSTSISAKEFYKLQRIVNESLKEIGKTGPKGLPGPEGPMGKKGEPGTHGLPGRKGDSGPPGPNGKPGKSGPRGERGQKGNAGPRGEKGSMGVPGIPGPSGEPGIPGRKGDTGNPGLPGRIGLPGPKGDSGSIPPELTAEAFENLSKRLTELERQMERCSCGIPSTGSPKEDEEGVIVSEDIKSCNNTVFPPPPLPVELTLRRKLMDELQSQQGSKECVSYALQYYKNCVNNTETNYDKFYYFHNVQCNDCHVNM